MGMKILKNNKIINTYFSSIKSKLKELKIFRKFNFGMIDNRLIWVLRHYIYKILFRKLSGIGYIGKPIFLKGLKGISIERNFRIFPGSRIECLGCGKILVGENVSIGHNLFLQTSSEVKIGKNVVISANVFIGTTDYIIGPYKDESFLSQPEDEKPVFIEDGVFIGYGSVILPGAYLSKGCVVGANSVVKGNFESNSVIGGAPARILRNR